MATREEIIAEAQRLTPEGGDVRETLLNYARQNNIPFEQVDQVLELDPGATAAYAAQSDATNPLTQFVVNNAPTDEQIKCMVPFAKLVVTILYIVLVAAFLIKVLSTILAGKVVVAATGTQMASISGPLTSLFAALGKGSAAKGMFSVFSAALKVKDAQKYAKEAQAKIDDSKEATMKSLFTNFKPAWNTCAVPTKEVKLTLEQRIDNIY